MIESASEFVRLRSSEDPAEYNRASREEASMSVWRNVIDEHPQYRFWVAQNKTVPIEILKILATDESATVRSMVASKRKLPDSLQVQLATDADESVRAMLARNAKVSGEALEILAKDSSPLVLAAVEAKM